MNVIKFWYANETAEVSSAWHYASGGFSLLCCIFGMVSNGLVIFVFLKNDGLQRPRNYFLINLAIADFGLLLTNNTFHVVSSFKKKWIFGQIGCDFYSVCGGIFGLTSIGTMAAISLSRLSAVNNPFRSLRMSSRCTLIILGSTWIYSCIWITPPLFGWNRFILEGFGTSCTFDYVSKDLSDRLFILLLITGGFCVPFLVILLSYSIILIKLSQRGRYLTPPSIKNKSSKQQSVAQYSAQSNLLQDARDRTGTNNSLDGMDDNYILRNLRRTEMRATRRALLICSVFCSAWGPYALMALISSFGFDYLVNAYTTAMLGMFTKLAACVNPLIYALSLNGFREKICSYLVCICHEERRDQRSLQASIPLNRKTPPNLNDSIIHLPNTPI